MRMCLTMICSFGVVIPVAKRAVISEVLSEEGFQAQRAGNGFFGTQFVVIQVKQLIYLTPVRSSRRNGGRLFITKSVSEVLARRFFYCLFCGGKQKTERRSVTGAPLCFLLLSQGLRFQARRSARLLQFSSTIAADFLSASSSACARLISRISSTPVAPSLTGTPI